AAVQGPVPSRRVEREGRRPNPADEVRRPLSGVGLVLFPELKILDERLQCRQGTRLYEVGVAAKLGSGLVDDIAYGRVGQAQRLLSQIMDLIGRVAEDSLRVGGDISLHSAQLAFELRERIPPAC